MQGLAVHDAMLVALALVAMTSSLVASLSRRARRVSRALLVVEAAMTGLLAALVGSGVALLAGSVTVATAAWSRRRPALSPGPADGAGPAAQDDTPVRNPPLPLPLLPVTSTDDDELADSVLADGDIGGAPRARRRRQPQPASTAPVPEPAARELERVGGLASLPLVVALFVLLLRPLLMASWPLAVQGRGQEQGAVVPGTAALHLPPLALPHLLLAALLLFSAGLLSALLRRSSAGAAIAVHLMTDAALLAIAALGFFVGAGDGVRLLALSMLAFCACPSLVLAVAAANGRGPFLDAEAAERVTRGITALAAGTALALLVGTA